MSQTPMRKHNSLLYLVIVAAVIAVFFTVLNSLSDTAEAPFSDIVDWAKDGRVQEISIEGESITAITTEGAKFKSRVGVNTDVVKVLQDAGVATGADGVDIRFKGTSGWGSLLRVIGTFLPIIFIGGLIFFMMRQAQGANNQTMGFGRSRAKLVTADRPNVTFNDVAGVEESKSELQEVVEFLKYPDRFLALGARIPKGVLLVGQPGTGKTLLARAVAGEAGVPFFSISGSEFVEMFVGVGAARVRDLFDQAKRNAPCIVFVDEIDAVGRQRGAGLGGGHDEREQTLNQILVEMDGFETNTNIIIIAATNRPDILDPALLRPGRFDRRVVLDLPDVVGRTAILKVHSAGKPMVPDMNLEIIAKETPGFSGADLSNLVNEAALLAARRGKTLISMSEFEESIDRVIAGPERKGRIINAKERAMTAYHEAGHALVAWRLPNADPVHKISIISRGSMGGYTRLLPEEDRYLWTKNQFEDRLAVALGGRVAEELVFTEITTGASNDLEVATRTALNMIKRYGMSKNLSPRTFGKTEQLVFLGRELHEERDYSDKVAEEIDQEVERLMQEAYERASQILTTEHSKLTEIAEHLLANESVEGVALKRLFDGSEPDAVANISKGPKPAPKSPSTRRRPTPGRISRPSPTLPSSQ